MQRRKMKRKMLLQGKVKSLKPRMLKSRNFKEVNSHK